MSILFRETQKFNILWGYLIFFLVCLINAIMAYKGAITSVTNVIVTLIPAVLILILFEWAKLETLYFADRVEIRFKPLKSKEVVVFWKDVKSMQIYKCKPLREFGGWGIRKSFSSTAYLTRGKTGLDMNLHEKDKRIFIGTQKEEELLKVLKGNPKTKGLLTF